MPCFNSLAVHFGTFDYLLTSGMMLGCCYVRFATAENICTHNSISNPNGCTLNFVLSRLRLLYPFPLVSWRQARFGGGGSCLGSCAWVG